MEAGALKYGLDVAEGRVESGKICRGLAERYIGLPEIDWKGGH